jgi:sigma-E factor negative regulatory protein RseB
MSRARYLRPGRLATLVAVATVMTGTVGLGTTIVTSTEAGADSDAAALLARARTAPQSETFSGLVEVRWTDEHGTHVERVGARSVQGSFVVGAGPDRFVGDGPLRWVANGTALAQAWQRPIQHRAPAPDAAWDVELGGTTTVAGRAATVVVAHDQDGVARARFAVDQKVGQLLRTEVLDRTGAVVRSIGFVQLTTTASAAVPSVSGGGGAAPVTLAKLPAGFVAPGTIANTYRLLGRYQRSDGSVQLYYSDGLFTMSVFEEVGTLDWASLPSGGRDARSGKLRTRTYSTSAGTVIVWTDGTLVMTCVADAPPDLAAAVVARVDATPAHEHGALHDIADFVLGPFGWN